MNDVLVGFLAARFGEDEAAARAATPGPWHTPGPDTVGQWEVYDANWAVARAVAYYHDDPLSSEPGARMPGYIDPDGNAAHIARHDPARVLREVEAKRRIVEECRLGLGEADSMPYGGASELAETTLRLMALPYSDHDDYRREWRP